MPDKGLRVAGLYGGARLDRMKVELTRKHLDQFGKCFVKLIAKEAKVDFAKRGWSGRAYDGTADIWDSFSFRISGDRTIEVLSTFPHIGMLTAGVPPHDMPWLTQEAHNKQPPNDKERKVLEERADARRLAEEAMQRTKKLGHVRPEPVTSTRLPLVVPIEVGGTVIFRAAPLKLANAWVHPGIARFTFVERALRKASTSCIQVFGQAALEHLVKMSQK